MPISTTAALWILFFIGAIAPIASQCVEVASPIGLWRAIDDATGSAGALVEQDQEDYMAALRRVS